MLIFYFLAIPAFFIFTSLLYNRDRKEGEIQVIPALKGLLWFVITVLFIFLFYKPETTSYRAGPLYLFYFLSEHLLFLFFGLTGFVLFYCLWPLKKGQTRLLQGFSFLTGFYMGISLFSYVIHFGELNFQFLFILPLLRCTTILLAALFLEKLLDSYGWAKLLYGGIILLIPAIMGLTELLYANNLVLLTFITALTLMAGAVILFQFLKDY